MTLNRKWSNEIRRLIAAFGYSCEGLKAAWTQPAFRVEIWVAACAFPTAMYLGGNGAARALMMASVVLVPIVELLNTAIEAAVDRVSIEWHLLAKRAKDIASAAVLLAIINAVVVWLIILLA